MEGSGAPVGACCCELEDDDVEEEEDHGQGAIIMPFLPRFLL